MKLNIQMFAATITIGTITETNPQMISLNWGVFIKGKSSVAIPVSATADYPIAEIILEFNGQKISRPGGSRTVTYTFNSYTLQKSGTNTVRVRINYGFNPVKTYERTTTINVEDYNPPVITQAIAKRVNANNVEDDNGTYLNVTFEGEITDVGNNDHIFRVGYKETGTSTYTYESIETSQYTCSQVDYRLVNSFLDGSKTYDITFEAIDSFYTSNNPIHTERDIETGFDLMNFNASGKSMAIGKVSQAGANDEILEVALKTIFDDDIDIKNTSLTLNNEWIMGYKASGDNFAVILPFNNAYKRTVNVNITSAEVYNGGWETITYGAVTAMQTFVKLGFTTTSTLTNGSVYLVRITGTISTQ